MLEQLIHQFETLHPAFFILGLALCPLAPIPVSPLWVLAGMRFGPVGGIMVSAIGLLLNFSIAYVLSKHLFRRQIEWFLKRWKVRIPVVPASDQTKFTLLVRIVPGNPLVVQNYLLGLVGVRFSTYFIVGLLVQMFYACGFVIFGEAVFEGRVGLLLFAVLLIVSIGIGIKLIAKRLVRAKDIDPV